MTGRLSPLGNASSDCEHETVTLREEHDRLNTSLAALTRHVAHVQFRLQQVISAPTSEDREVDSHQLFYSIDSISIELTHRIA